MEGTLQYKSITDDMNSVNSSESSSTVDVDPIQPKLVFSILNLHSAINGVALANVGAGVMWLKFASTHQFRHRVLYTVYGLTIYSAILICLYIIRVMYDPVSWFKQELQTPSKIFRMGVMANAICLIAAITSTSELDFPELVPLAITSFGLMIQIPSMIWFLHRCILTVCLPEPFYNAALQSCLFPVISLPGKSYPIVVMRRLLLVFGLITVVPSTFIQMYRVLMPRKSETEIVANNASVCIMQAGFSITLVAWLQSPLTRSSNEGIGGIISHTLFAISTCIDLATWVAIYQRRHAFWTLGMNPSLAAISFPFASSGIAANLYYSELKSTFSPGFQQFLQVWIWFLTMFASVLIAAVNLMYIFNLYYLRSEEQTPVVKSKSNQSINNPDYDLEFKDANTRESGQCNTDISPNTTAMVVEDTELYDHESVLRDMTV